jgi:hypothetical protein
MDETGGDAKMNPAGGPSGRGPCVMALTSAYLEAAATAGPWAAG